MPRQLTGPDRARTLLAGALLALAVTAAPAAGADPPGGASCARAATVDSGIVLAANAPAGQPPASVNELRRGQLYTVADAGAATISFQGVRYTLAARSRFILGCFGENKSVGGRFPRVALAAGRADVRTTAGQTGAVSNFAGMVNPQQRIRTAFTVTAPALSRLKATKSASQPGRLQVTPYAGPRHGVCRYVTRSAVLDAGADTASYDGRRAR